MMNDDVLPSKVATEHQAKLAYVYVRQSSLSQVTRHGESTDLQYRLVERAVQLGWPRERVKVIDKDLGKSGASAEQRSGFQYLIAEIALARVGLVVSWDASRLARNNSDWHQLLELCSHFGTLIADSESLHDPRLYHDRLLLGLSGMMSEAELHNLKMRLHAGEWHKAERGELRLPLPVGLTRLRGGEVVLTPDEEVQGRIHLVFAKFKEVRSARAVVRYFRREKLLLPSRPLRGPAPHEILWRPARTSAILSILKKPAYAGTYVYGRQTTDPARRKPGHPKTGRVTRPIDKWPIVIHNHYPAYITWEEFLANQAKLQANQNRYQEGKAGVPRKGQALLQGIAICGRCGARMRLRYSGPKGNFPVYECYYGSFERGGGSRCQELRALGLDTEIEQILLQALAPDKVALALAALEQLEQEYATLRRQRELRLERAQYEAERARRQYNAVEPENRLVARTLERAWEEKLRAVEQVEQEYQAWLQQHRLELTARDQEDILALGEDLPALWHAQTTTPADRKQIVRLLIKEVILDQGRERGKVWFQINWQTGATSEHWLIRHVQSYSEHAHLETLQKRISELAAGEKTDIEIAAILNKEGLQTARGFPFSNKVVWLLRRQWGVSAAHASSSDPLRWEDGTFTINGAAAEIGVIPATIHKWLKTGRIQGCQPAKGAPWRIPLTNEQITSLRRYVKRVRRSKKEAS
jgi:DNA invertase Pin-like site-specific DNA recombinase